MNVNSQYFDKEQIEAGEMQHLLEFLMNEAYGKGKYYNDIHIKPSDCGAFTVEWVQVPWDHDFGGSFQYVDSDEVVMKECEMPDGSYQYFKTDDDFLEAVQEFLNEHPTYTKSSVTGRWYDRAEYEANLKTEGSDE